MRRLTLAASALLLIAGPALAQPVQPPTGQTIKTVPNYPASGVAPLSCTISAAGSCGPFTPLAGRAAHYTIDGVSGSGVMSCQLIRMLDGSTAMPITVSAGGTTTIMNNPPISSNRVSEDFEEDQTSVPYYISCGATFNSSAYGSYTSGSAAVKFSQ